MITKPLWVEAVLCAGCTWPDGREVVPFEPFEVSGPFRVGSKGAQLEWRSYEFRLVPHENGLLVAHHGRTSLVAPLETFWPELSAPSPLILRVLRTPRDTAGWPRSIPRPPTPWTAKTYEVLADSFQELGFTAAQRFVHRAPSEDHEWLPTLTLLRPRVIEWERGLVDTLSADINFRFEWGFTLAAQLLSVSMRRLTLRHLPRQGGGRPAPTRPVDPTPLLRGLIAAGGLPCLERFQLEFDIHPGSLRQELLRLPGWTSAFPSLQSLEVGISAWPFATLG